MPFLLTVIQMINNIITDLSREHRQDFHVVRLNGFIHTDDKLALKEIWRQLGKEMQVDDDLLSRVSIMNSRICSLNHGFYVLLTTALSLFLSLYSPIMQIPWHLY